MAIPRDTRQAQLQTPKVAEGRAVDASKRVAEAYQPAINLNKQASDTGASILNFLQKEERATAMYDAQNATNEYIQERQKLDEWFQTQTYDEARKSLPRYYTEAQKLHDKFVGSIDKIKVADIREGFRKKINGFNQSQSNQIEAFVYKQKKEAEDLSMKSSLNLGSQEAARVVSPTATAENNWKAISASMQPYMAQYNEYMENNNIPQEAREVYRQQWINRTLAMAVNNMSTKVDRNGIDPYKDVHQFAVQARPIMSEDTWQEMITGLEKQRLDLAFDKNPEQFETNGKFNDSIAAYYAPNMNTEARRKHIKQVSAGNSANGGAGGADLAEVNKMFLNDIRQQFINIGRGEEFDAVMKDGKFLTDAQKSQQKLNFKNASAEQIFDMIQILDDYSSGQIAYNSTTGAYRLVNSESNANKLDADGFKIYNNPLVATLTDSEENKIENLRNMLVSTLANKGHNKELDKSKLFTDTKPSFKDVLITEPLKAEGEQFGKEDIVTRLIRKVPFIGDEIAGRYPNGISDEAMMAAIKSGLASAGQEIANINEERRKMSTNARQYREIDTQWIYNVDMETVIKRLDDLNKSEGNEGNLYSDRILGAYTVGLIKSLAPDDVNRLFSIQDSAGANLVNISPLEQRPEELKAQYGRDFKEAYYSRRAFKDASYNKWQGVGVTAGPGSLSSSEIDYLKRIGDVGAGAAKYARKKAEEEALKEKMKTFDDMLR